MGSHQHVIDLEAKISSHDVLRMMGCCGTAPVRPEFESLVDRLLKQVRDLLRPRGVYVVRQVERMTDTELVLENCPPIRGPVA